MIDAQTLQSPTEAALLFRTILASFAKPAVPVSIAKASDAPAPLLATVAAIAVTLFDYQTPIWLSPELDQDDIRKFIRFHTGAPLTTNPSEASFALMTIAETENPWPDFNLGTHEYPDRSTTVIFQASALANGKAVSVSGPGLKDPVHFSVQGATTDFWHHLQNNNSFFPIGNDFVFACPNTIAVLPRSSRIEMMESV